MGKNNRGNGNLQESIDRANIMEDYDFDIGICKENDADKK